MDKGNALSYATIAMENLGYSQEEIERVTNAMLIEMDRVPEGSAADRADEIIYGDED